MKKQTTLPLITMVSVILIFSIGCKKSPASYNPLPPPGIEEPNIPGVIMTLAAISYVAEGNTPAIIEDSIRILLADSSLATGGKWDLVWGPGIAIRGTSVKSIQDILEDLIAFSMIQFPYGEAGDSIAKGMMEGFTALLLTKDPEKGTTLEEFLKTISANNKIPLYVTGHSQGGGLAPLMTYWLVTNELLKDKFVVNTYAFAGAGIVNKSFRDNFMNALPPDASFHRLVNPIDVIPFFWTDLPGIVAKKIPVPVPLGYRFLLSIAEGALQIAGLTYYQITEADTIGRIPVTDNVPGIHPSDTLKWYNYWWKMEHKHDSYLKILGVKPIKPV